MILNALYDCYELLASDPECSIAMKGYSQAACSYALNLRRDGLVTSVLPLAEGKKKLALLVPEQKNRPGKTVTPYFLCDKSKYLLGKEYNKQIKALAEDVIPAEASLELHQMVLKDVEDPGAEAVLAFLKRIVQDGYRLDMEETDPVFQGALIVFRLEGETGYIHERYLIRKAWENHCEKREKTENSVLGQCLITGQYDVPIAETHTMIRGIKGTNAAGAAIVSYNAPAYVSYGKEQSYNAPVSKTAMFRYTTALNYLLAQRENRMLLGDTTVVLWTSKGSKGKETDYLRMFLEGGSFEEKKANSAEEVTEDCIEEQGLKSSNAIRDFDAEKLMRDVILRVRRGWEIPDQIESEIDLNTTTFLLGLSPNNARIAIRFWYQNTLEEFTKKMAQHYCDMEIVKSPKARRFASIRDILKSTAVQEDLKNVPSTMERGLFHAILNGTLYPRAVYNQILMRMRNEAGKDYGVNHSVRAGFVKAYLLRYYRVNKMQEKEEGITVSLNKESTDVAYNLGRLFAVLERLQGKANNGNTNIRANYFSSASTTPQSVFPRVLQLAQKHIEKTGYNVYWDREIEALLDRIDDNFPATLSLIEQGTFILGYYNQKQYDYSSKEEK